MNPTLFEDDFEEPKPRKQVFEPRNAYDFCKVFASITGRPIGLFLKDTKHWPLNWFIEVQSLCKEKPRDKQASTVNWYVKNARTKEINLKESLKNDRRIPK